MTESLHTTGQGQPPAETNPYIQVLNKILGEKVGIAFQFGIGDQAVEVIPLVHRDEVYEDLVWTVGNIELNLSFLTPVGAQETRQIVPLTLRQGDVELSFVGFHGEQVIFEIKHGEEIHVHSHGKLSNLLVIEKPRTDYNSLMRPVVDIKAARQEPQIWKASDEGVDSRRIDKIEAGSIVRNSEAGLVDIVTIVFEKDEKQTTLILDINPQRLTPRKVLEMALFEPETLMAMVKVEENSLKSS